MGGDFCIPLTLLWLYNLERQISYFEVFNLEQTETETESICNSCDVCKMLYRIKYPICFIQLYLAHLGVYFSTPIMAKGGFREKIIQNASYGKIEFYPNISIVVKID